MVVNECKVLWKIQQTQPQMNPFIFQFVLREAYWVQDIYVDIIFCITVNTCKKKINVTVILRFLVSIYFLRSISWQRFMLSILRFHLSWVRKDSPFVIFVAFCSP